MNHQDAQSARTVVIELLSENIDFGIDEKRRLLNSLHRMGPNQLEQFKNVLLSAQRRIARLKRLYPSQMTAKLRKARQDFTRMSSHCDIDLSLKEQISVEAQKPRREAHSDYTFHNSVADENLASEDIQTARSRIRY